MAEDCFVFKGNDYFRFRAGGIIIHDNKMLFVKSDFGEKYYYMIGGCVHIGETTQSCIEREIEEEAGIKAKAERLAVLCENFFYGDGGVIDRKNCHTIEMYYIMSVEDISNLKSVSDDGEEIVWIPLDEVKNSFIKPAFIPERIDEILSENKIIHIIENRDK
ncbi:MAG: NUDIX domain-containing protein [Lachnospiraceae bacterium]|jgi:8-oxo-dGTP pyrophosphatase MutT (NUDIX family)|nr:NUDIX domain-containing protein [Lachnospiraceae bacterium]